jgi:hypothetical protein
LTRIPVIFAAAAALMPLAASAYPQGAPWTALDDPGGACAGCHLGSPPVAVSEALTLEGVKTPFASGTTYPMTLRFAPEAGQVGGFLAVFDRTDGNSGSLRAGADLETNGRAVRSTSARPLRARGGTAWSFTWTAPETPGPVVLRIAANAGNDDASPLGDMVHVKKLVLEVAREAD